ncbi:MAG: hypothetical protein HY904_12695 [Deltaproteobacteria bacterium]|nr:hypothetical protein [Deltaproteobacteria bacterium]
MTGPGALARWQMAVEDCPDGWRPFLSTVHARVGLGDGWVTVRMVERFLAENARDPGALVPAEALLQAPEEPACAPAVAVLRDALAPLPVLGRPPAAVRSAESTTGERTSAETWTTLADPRGREGSTEDTGMGLTDAVTAPTAEQVPPLATPGAYTPMDAGAALVEHTNQDDQSPAPGRLDAQGRLYAEHQDRPLVPASPELAEALETMAQAVEEGAGWPEGARTLEGRTHLMTRLEEAVAAGLGQDDIAGMAPLAAVRLRVAACALALALARREDDEDLQTRAGALLTALLAGEPRRSVRSALAAALMAWPDLPPDAGEMLLSALAELMPVAPAYAAWEALRAPGDPLWVRHVVYATEYKLVRDGYEAAGFARVQERPLVLQRDVPGGRPIRVEVRRAQAGLVLSDERDPEEVLILSGLAFVVERTAPAFPRVVVAAFRRDPFGVPRIADRFPGDHVIGVARGDKPLDDVGYFTALLAGLARKEPYALLRQKCRETAPLMTLRTLWPHEPGALRAAGGAPSPFTADPTAIVEHRLTWASPRASRRPFDLKWRNDAPDTTSYLAMEVAASLASTPVGREDLPVLEPGGFHEGLPDVDVQVGAALWRVSLTRGLCGQAEEALAALVTLHTHARHGELAGETPRSALLLGAVHAARMVVLHCATRELARDVVAAVLRHAGMPAAIKLEHLLAAAEDPEALNALKVAHHRWAAG